MSVEECISAGAGAGRGGGGGEETTSPKGRVKFLCSYGGKILLRPSDGVLKYFGGETRVVAVPRDITFSELMKKISQLFEGEFVLKYQIGSEDLDALVSVKSDEDVGHMMDEYDRQERESEGCLHNIKLKTFLFPNKPTTIIETQTHNQNQTPFSVITSAVTSIEQRFVDAINGVVRTSNTSGRPLLGSSRLKSVSNSPSECTTPHSLSPTSMMANEASGFDSSVMSINRLSRMHKVHSSPNLSNLASSGQQGVYSSSSSQLIANSNGHQIHTHHQQQQQQQQMFLPGNNANGYCYNIYSHPQHHYQYHHHHHQPYYSGCQSPPSSRPPQAHFCYHGTTPPQPYFRPADFSNVLASQPSTGMHSGGKTYYYPLHRAYPGSGGHNRWGHLADYAAAACEGGARMAGADNSIPHSPRDKRKTIWE